MPVTATELKNNPGKYLVLSATEDVLITKNGKVVAKLTNPYQDRVQTAKSLFGIFPERRIWKIRGAEIERRNKLLQEAIE